MTDKDIEVAESQRGLCNLTIQCRRETLGVSVSDGVQVCGKGQSSRDVLCAFLVEWLYCHTESGRKL